MIRLFEISLECISAVQFSINADTSTLTVAAEDWRSVKVIDFGNAIRCIHNELSLYYDDFELQTLLYRAPEVSSDVCSS